MEQAAKWVYDFSHSTIGFSVIHFGISETEGRFKKFEGIASRYPFGEALHC